jgi:NAD(P)-dependent dehydrogenase (short-subunit alcohol dehydrogenase family)
MADLSRRMDYDLEDKVLAVTGGSRGIGRVITELLLEQGAKVAVCARKQSGLDALQDALKAGDRLLTVKAHAARTQDVEEFFSRTLESFGQIDGLVHNVGMNIFSSVVDVEEALWHKIIDSNLNGAFLCARKAGQIMRMQKHGKIVSVSSLAGTRAAPGMGIYGIAKAAIEMMTRVLAQELAAFNVQVNAVSPGMVRTQFSEPMWSNKALYDHIVKGIPLGRIAEPIEIAHPILFLCSHGADFITGQTFQVDGGASAV